MIETIDTNKEKPKNLRRLTKHINDSRHYKSLPKWSSLIKHLNSGLYDNLKVNIKKITKFWLEGACNIITKSSK